MKVIFSATSCVAYLVLAVPTLAFRGSQLRMEFKPKEERNIDTRFRDVLGCNYAVREVQDIVKFLKDPEPFLDIGARLPSGVLFYGAPGLGKTLLARAIAGEAGVPFYSQCATSFINTYVGVGAANVRKLFDAAEAKAPALVFIDEIDAIGSTRAEASDGGGGERDATLLELLNRLDGFSKSNKVIVIAATNRVDRLDSALTRAGRFDRKVQFRLPDSKGRQEILQLYGRGMPTEGPVDLCRIGQTAHGMSGSDLATAVNEAKIATVLDNRSAVTEKDLREAFERVSIGVRIRDRQDNAEALAVCAVHEGGHAILAHEQEPGSVQFISIVPGSGGEDGYTKSGSVVERQIVTKSYIWNKIVMLLGGRAAEEIVFGRSSITTGASDDLDRAADLARKMVVNLEMDGEPYRAVPSDERIRSLLHTAYRQARTVLLTKFTTLRAVADVLIDKRELTGEEFTEIVYNREHFGSD